MHKRRVDFYLKLLSDLEGLSTCRRLKVGAFLVKDNRVIVTGYNGSAAGLEHCEDYFKTHEYTDEAHREFSKNNEIHDVQSLISFCAKHGVSTNGCQLFCSYSPCIACAKMLVNSGIKQVFVREKYDRADDDGCSILQKSGILIDFISNLEDNPCTLTIPPEMPGGSSDLPLHQES